MSRIGFLSVVMIAGALALPRAASSQTPSVGSTSPAGWLAPTPSRAMLLAPAWPREARIEGALARVPELPQVRNRRGIPFMVAGGALFLGGAIIGDDAGTILMLGGVGLGAYGAYVYFGG